MLNIDPAWIDTYEENYRHALQQRQSVLSPCLLTGSMTGEKKRFTYIGKASMVERGDSNGDTKWQSLDFDSRWVGRRIFDFPVLIDEFADIESALTDPTSDIMKAGIMAANTRKDVVIKEAFDATVYTGKNGETPVAFPSENIIDVQLGSGSSASNQPLNLAKLKEVRARLLEAEVPPEDTFYFVCSPRQINALLDDDHVTSTDYNAVRALCNGSVDSFMGFKFIVYNGLDIESGVRSCFAWASSSMQLVISKEMKVKGPVEIPTKNFQTGLEITMALDAVRLYDQAVYKVPCAE